MLQRKSPDILLLLLNVTLQLKSLDFLDGQIELSCLPGLTWVWTDGFMLNSEIEVHGQEDNVRVILVKLLKSLFAVFNSNWLMNNTKM